MNTMQSALRDALPGALEAIRKEARKQDFELAAARGKDLLLQATKATTDGDPRRALAAVRKDRHACACYLAKTLKRPMQKGYAELELMERFWAEKARAQEAQRRAAEAEASAHKAKVKAEVDAVRRMAQQPRAVA